MKGIISRKMRSISKKRCTHLRVICSISVLREENILNSAFLRNGFLLFCALNAVKRLIIKMKILFASDMSFNFIENCPEEQAVKEAMSEVSSLFAEADYSIVNLENIFGNK